MKVPSQSKIGLLISGVLGIFSNVAQAKTCTGMYHYTDTAGGYHTPTVTVTNCPGPRSAGALYDLKCVCGTTPQPSRGVAPMSSGGSGGSGGGGGTYVYAACYDEYNQQNDPGQSWGDLVHTYGTVTFDRCFVSD